MPSLDYLHFQKKPDSDIRFWEIIFWMESQKYYSKNFLRLRIPILLKWPSVWDFKHVKPIPEQDIRRLLVTKMYIGFILILLFVTKLAEYLSMAKKLFSVVFGGRAIWTRVLIDIFISFIGHIRSLGVINFTFYWSFNNFEPVHRSLSHTDR